MIDRRRWSAGVAAVWALAAGRLPAAAAPSTSLGPKVLRYAFEVAETSLDPVKVTDLYSRYLTAHIFEGLYGYDYLARPVKIKPQLAAAMPETSADYRTWTIRVRPGVYFQRDEAFGGVPREVVAQDFVYAWKRYADPANRSPGWNDVESEGLLGLADLRQRAIDQRVPFDYDREAEGVRALDRYTLQFKLKAPRPRFIESLAQSDTYSAIAREVVEHYGAQFEAHPVGTGPFRLAQWRRSSRLVFERNPDYREVLYEAEPAADDLEGQALVARYKGRRLPLVDRVEISIIEEEQPRWLSFLNDEADLAYQVGYQFASQAMPNGKVAPNLVKRGVRGYPVVEAAGNYWYFNLEDPQIGGYTPERVALRRAIGLGIDVRQLIDYAYQGLGTLSQGPVLPGTSAYDPHLKTEFSDYDPGRAKALLELYGYRLEPASGKRLHPDGTPVILNVATTQNQRDRKIAEVLTKNMKALGIQVRSASAQWPENLKAARAGKLQMWSLGASSAKADSGDSLARFDSRQFENGNFARIRMPVLDALYDRLQLLPDGPERLATFREVERLAIAYMPYKFTLNRVSIDMAQPQLIGYRRPLFSHHFWQYVDIDESRRRS